MNSTNTNHTYQGLRVTGNRILVKLVQPQRTADVTSSVIEIPDQFKEQSNEAIVKAVGTPPEDKPFEVNVGDRVLLTKFTNVEIILNGEDCKFVTPDEILCVLDPTNP